MPAPYQSDLAGLEVVAAHLLHAAGDDLRAAAVLDDERSRPRIDLVACRAPAFLACALVEPDDERPALVIPDDNEHVAVERRRAAFAELHPHRLVAEILLPDRRALHVEGVDAARLEGRDDVRAVGDDRRRGPRSPLLMAGLVRRVLTDDTLPHRATVLAVDRQHQILVRPRRLAASGVRLGFIDADRYRRRKEEEVAPDDRRAGTPAGDFLFPADVLRLAPLERRLGEPRDASAFRSAPLRPVAVGVGCGQDRGRRGKHDGEGEQEQICGDWARTILRALLRHASARRFSGHRRRTPARAPGGKAAQRQGDARIDEERAASRGQAGCGFADQTAELTRVREPHPTANFLPACRGRVRFPPDISTSASVKRERGSREAVPVPHGPTSRVRRGHRDAVAVE